MVATGAQPILDANQREAERNRGYFRARGILALNLVSSPGSGKTTLLRATLERLHARVGCAVVVGDLETQADAEALRPSGAPVVQITTGTVCHLDARMVAAAVDTLPKDGVRLALHRKRRQPRLPGILRSRRSPPHRPVSRDRRRKQTAEIPADLPWRPRRGDFQNRSGGTGGLRSRPRPPSHRPSRTRGGNHRAFRRAPARASTPGSPSSTACWDRAGRQFHDHASPLTVLAGGALRPALARSMASSQGVGFPVHGSACAPRRLDLIPVPVAQSTPRPAVMDRVPQGCAPRWHLTSRHDAPVLDPRPPPPAHAMIGAARRGGRPATDPTVRSRLPHRAEPLGRRRRLRAGARISRPVPNAAANC